MGIENPVGAFTERPICWHNLFFGNP